MTRQDAIWDARQKLELERKALARFLAAGWEREARWARREIDRLETRVARLAVGQGHELR